MTTTDLHDKIIDRIRTVYDPEIPVNLYDLGLIYNLALVPVADGKFNADIAMTLTTPHCPVAAEMPQRVRMAVEALEEIADAAVRLVWDPPWTKDRMTDEAKLQLNLL